MTVLLRIFGAALLLVAAFASPRPAWGKDDASARLSGPAMLDRMAGTYRLCKTYRDSGVVRVAYFKSNGDFSHTQTLRFETAFVRPGAFRFSFVDLSPGRRSTPYIVWQAGSRIRTWWDPDEGVAIEKSLSRALAGATGVSDGAAHTVPRLLLPEVGGVDLHELIGSRRIGDAPCGQATCARIEGEYAGEPSVVWIELGTFLLRRIDAKEVFPTFRTEETTTYEPTMDGAISPELLEFDPPRP